MSLIVLRRGNSTVIAQVHGGNGRVAVRGAHMCFSSPESLATFGRSEYNVSVPRKGDHHAAYL